MALRSLLKKELHWSRHNVLALLFVLLLLPATLAGASVAFQHVIPRDAPVAVTPQDPTVTGDDLTIIEGGVTLFSDPEVVDSTAEARTMLGREEYYAVLQVPPNITDGSETNATFVLYVDGSIVPFTEASKAIRNVMGFWLQRLLPANTNVERVVVGEPNTLSEFLVPIALMGIVLLLAFTYVPYNLDKESNVLDRLRVESSLESVVTAKLVYFAALLVVPILVVHGAATYLGYQVATLAPLGVATLLLTFVYLTAISTSVMILTKFGTIGRFVNVIFLFSLLAFSGLAYPVGYFSPLRKAIVRLVPVHYSMILTRSAMMKDLDPGVFADWLVGLVGVTVVCLLVLKLSAVYYRRTI